MRLEGEDIFAESGIKDRLTNLLVNANSNLQNMEARPSLKRMLSIMPVKSGSPHVYCTGESKGDWSSLAHT